MICNIEQRQGKFIVSYVKKDGTLGYTQYTIPASEQYMYMYDKRGRGIPEFKSWDFKPVRKVPTQFLNRHRIHEFFMNIDEANTNHLYELNIPTFSSADIEVEVTDEGFANPENANNRITAISFCQNFDITVFASKILSGDDCKFIENEINKHIKPYSKKQYTFIYKYHENEADMIYDFLYNYVRLSPLITGWNFWGFDWRYIMNRCKRLNMNVSWLSPSGQWYDHKIRDKNNDVKILLPMHKFVIDYMTIYQKWDRTIEVKENDTLDFVAEEALGIKKVKYPGTLQELYEKDFIKFITYSAIDSILIQLIDNKLKTMNTFLGLANITKVEAMSAFSPIHMLEATLTRYAYKRGQVFPKIEDRNIREKYEGAFVYEPKPNLSEWVASFDFASLYPSLMRQFKISIENFKFKDKNHIPNKNEIKTSSGSVFDSSYDPLIPTILTDYYKERKKAQKTSLTAENEANELIKILKERKKKAAIN